MAHVTGRSRGRLRGRAQLLVVGAILLAVVLVGLALVLNSAIFAENLATRQSDASASDVRAFRSAAVAGTGAAIESSNRAAAGAPFAQLRDDEYQPRVETLSSRLASRRAQSGTLVGVTTTDSRAGTQLVDDDASGDLRPHDGGVTNWTMAPGAHVRAFDLTVTPDPGTTLGDLLTGGSGDAFVVTLDPATAPAHEVAVYEDGGVRVAVSEVGSDTVEECDVSGGTVNLSLTGRPTADGAYCDALERVATTTGTYDVTVTNGDLATGTYRLVVDRTDGPTAAEAALDEQVDRLNYGTACESSDTYANDTADSPHSVPAIYAGTVELRYQDAQATSRTTSRVVPSQAGDGLTTPVVTSLSVADDSAGDEASLTVDWAVEDPNGDLDSVTVDVTDRNDSDGRAETTGVADGSGSGSLNFTDGGDFGDGYEVTVTVSDGTDERSRTVRHTADGDDAGCPP
ncbi:hypothetical protein DP107_14315 [Haloglomus irregulare]|uniref:Uncharacterized protein n=1 Tax=Haloglomus irregulare TaxID=2234134 RepID=A0A554MXH9_9EURY|nr:hypothetical protein DP107_14315 [Haloglomus irregulare]